MVSVNTFNHKLDKYRDSPKVFYCSMCSLKITNDKCFCANGPYILHLPVKETEEDYWMLDGSIKPLEIHFSALIFNPKDNPYESEKKRSKEK